MKKLFLAMMVCAGLCACSSDDIDLASSSPKIFEGDVAYMTINLSDVGGSTRATSPEPYFEQGGTDEHNVSTANFYFYDSTGDFVSQGEVWDGGTDAGTNNLNIEFEGDAVVILKGLKNKEYPKYVVTVLNQPSDFTYGTTLDEMVKKVSTTTYTPGIFDSNEDGKNFVMSTTSYVHSDSESSSNYDSNYYFVTELQDENFTEEPIDAEDPDRQDVTIYVERLAAKVTLDVSNDLANDKKDLGNGTVLYKLTESIAGDENKEDVTEVEGDGETQTERSGEATENLYVKLNGWKLNATAQKSYMMKNINTAWTITSGENNIGTAWSESDWNDATNHRSYWGKSYTYDNLTEDETNGGYEELTYVNLLKEDEGETKAIGTLIDMGSSAYCAENTNTVGDDGIIQTKYSPAITSIVVSAEVCDENGNGLDLVRYNGMLYTKKSYINEILTTLNKAGNLNYYKDQNGTQQIDADCVELSEDASGYLLITLSNDDNNTYYVSSEGGNSSPIDGTVTLNTDQTSTAYTGGQMFYYIPIEHLNNPASGIEEAEYGVVRNHHYSVTITSLENIGRAVFDPSETIIPDDSWDEDEKYYYVGAVIDILSWKMVEKGVGL